MDEELFEFAKDNDLSFEEAEEVQDFADDEGLDLDEAHELWQKL
ncbi:MAG: hypothetical protein WAN61_00470 [Minisyncoccia bacterium]